MTLLILLLVALVVAGAVFLRWRSPEHVVCERCGCARLVAGNGDRTYVYPQDVGTTMIACRSLGHQWKASR